MKKRKLGNTVIEDINAALIICGSFSVIFIGYLLYFIFQTDYRLMPYLTIPLIFGLVWENRRLDSDWKMLVLKLLIAIIGASLFQFYYFSQISLSAVVKNWPYVFIFIFAGLSAVYHNKKVTAKITEGITLLQSVSLIYWVINYSYLDFSNFLEASVLGITLIFSLFSFYNAFTYQELSSKTRLLLSIWSSVVLSVFSIVYIYRVYNYNYFIGDPLVDYLLNMIQYFFLGISLTYLIQNGRMITVYIPSRHNDFDREHLNRITEMNKLHVWRYSKEQVKIKDSIFILFYTSLVYSINYLFQLIPAFTLIWIVFWSAPIVIFLKNKAFVKSNNVSKT